MKFFFPDSQDQINPTFDFEREESSVYHVRQRDDRYAHETLGQPPYDGILLSKAVVDGIGAAGRYSAAHRNRLYREGIASFFRLDTRDEALETMGDCGAFAYARESVPPYTADEVIDFYETCGFDFGFSVDHVILGFDASADRRRTGVDREWRRRHSLTIKLATEFLRRHEARRCVFDPIGVAQGWSPASYAEAVSALQAVGYSRVALGGMVPLKTPEILACLDAVGAVLDPAVQIHLLGVTRLESITRFSEYGVTSFDSTSPFRQAFMDADDNYYTLDSTYCAIRVPQSDGNTTLRNQITAGQLPQEQVRALEDAALTGVRSYASNESTLEQALGAVCAYEEFVTGRSARQADYGRTLAARPWETCDCAICVQAGAEVVLFRGTERNKRRGFHNLKVFRERLDRKLESPTRMTGRKTRVLSDASELRLPALRIRQGGGQEVYSFAVDGKKLRGFAAVSRAKRSDDAELSGYQRPEALAHVRAIRRYLESDGPIMPNSIVIAFDERVAFVPLAGSDSKSADAVHGHLVIPYSPDQPESEKPGWIVDGQQRSAAIRESRLDHFPVYVTAFVARDEAQQRSQFILVNATKPLPKGLIHELLPSSDEDLPVVLARRRLPAYLVEQLNFREGSPLFGRIRTPTVPKGVIKDNSVLKMLERSITDGTLYHYRDPETGWGETEAMLEILCEFWSAVAEVFPGAWNLTARDSRLVHGAGFISMGSLMDEVAERVRGSLEPTRQVFAAHLEVIAPHCAWTSGHWQLQSGRRAWDDIQNTGREVQLLSDHLIGVYRAALRSELVTDVPQIDAAA